MWCPSPSHIRSVSLAPCFWPQSFKLDSLFVPLPSTMAFLLPQRPPNTCSFVLQTSCMCIICRNWQWKTIYPLVEIHDLEEEKSFSLSYPQWLSMIFKPFLKCQVGKISLDKFFFLTRVREERRNIFIQVDYDSFTWSQFHQGDTSLILAPNRKTNVFVLYEW